MNPKNKYRKGADFERKLVNYARAMGHSAFRCAGSKSGKVGKKIDVCIINNADKTIHFIQAKKGSRKYSRREIEEFEETLENYTIKYEFIDKKDNEY